MRVILPEGYDTFGRRPLTSHGAEPIVAGATLKAEEAAAEKAAADKAAADKAAEKAPKP